MQRNLGRIFYKKSRDSFYVNKKKEKTAVALMYFKEAEKLGHNNDPFMLRSMSRLSTDKKEREDYYNRYILLNKGKTFDDLDEVKDFDDFCAYINGSSGKDEKTDSTLWVSDIM